MIYRGFESVDEDCDSTLLLVSGTEMQQLGKRDLRRVSTGSSAPIAMGRRIARNIFLLCLNAVQSPPKML
jgi:hypothetical protein